MTRSANVRRPKRKRTISERVRVAKDAKDRMLDEVLIYAAQSHQLPNRIEHDTDGSFRLFFPHGQVFFGRWDHSGATAAYVGSWFIKPRFSA